MAQKLGGSGGLHNVCRIRIMCASKQDGRRGRVALATVPPDNEKLPTFGKIETYVRIWVGFLNCSNHIFSCPSILIDRCCAHDNQIGLIAFALATCQNNNIYIQADTFQPLAWAMRKKTSIRTLYELL